MTPLLGNEITPNGKSFRQVVSCALQGSEVYSDTWRKLSQGSVFSLATATASYTHEGREYWSTTRSYWKSGQTGRHLHADVNWNQDGDNFFATQGRPGNSDILAGKDLTITANDYGSCSRRAPWPFINPSPGNAVTDVVEGIIDWFRGHNEPAGRFNCMIGDNDNGHGLRCIAKECDNEGLQRVRLVHNGRCIIEGDGSWRPLYKLVTSNNRQMIRPIDEDDLIWVSGTNHPTAVYFLPKTAHPGPWAPGEERDDWSSGGYTSIE